MGDGLAGADLRSRPVGPDVVNIILTDGIECQTKFWNGTETRVYSQWQSKNSAS